MYDYPMDELRRLWPGGPLYAGDAVTGDALALADFAGAVRARRGVELCCGCGVVMLLLARERPELSLTGVELRGAAAEACRRNLAANGLTGRCDVLTGDLRSVALSAGQAELVVANPPFFPVGAGARSPREERSLMRVESATLPELCAAAARLLRGGGSFCLIHRAERLGELFAALREAGLEPKRIRLMAHDARRAPELCLCEARPGAAPGIRWEPTLFQRDVDGTETAEYKRISHWEA